MWLIGLPNLKNTQSYDLIVMTRDLNKIKQKQYIVTITEAVQGNFVITAGNKEEAIRLAQPLHHSGQLVLEPGKLVNIKFEAQVAHKKTRR